MYCNEIELKPINKTNATNVHKRSKFIFYLFCADFFLIVSCQFSYTVKLVIEVEKMCPLNTMKVNNFKRSNDNANR